MLTRISFKIMLTIILCTILTLAIAGGLSIRQGSRYIKEQTIEKLEYMGRSYEKDFDGSLTSAEICVESLNAAITSSFDFASYKSQPTYLKEYQVELDNIIKNFSESDLEALGLYVTFDPYLSEDAYEVWYEDINNDGNMLRVTEDLIRNETGDWTPSWEGYPNREIFRNRSDKSFQYLYKTMSEKKAFWFGPYDESGLDLSVISYVMPLTIENETIGVVGIDINFEDMKKTIDNIKIYDNGYALLFSENLKPIVVPKGDSEQKQITKMIAKEKKSSGLIEYKYDGKSQILSYNKLTNDWVLCLVPDSQEIYEPIASLTKWMIFILFLCVIFSVLTAYYFSRRVSRKMEDAANQLRRIEMGDLTQSIPHELINGRDELSQFVKSAYSLQSALKDITSTLDLHKKGDVSKYDVNIVEEGDRQRDAVMIFRSRQAQMGEMIGTIAHQWKQPLNKLAVIISEILDMYEYDNLEKKELESAVEKSMETINQMAKTIDDFREFLNPTREKNTFSAIEQIKFACELADYSIRKNEIQLDMDLQDELFVYGYSNEFA